MMIGEFADVSETSTESFPTITNKRFLNNEKFDSTSNELDYLKRKKEAFYVQNLNESQSLFPNESISDIPRKVIFNHINESTFLPNDMTQYDPESESDSDSDDDDGDYNYDYSKLNITKDDIPLDYEYMQQKYGNNNFKYNGRRKRAVTESVQAISSSLRLACSLHPEGEEAFLPKTYLNQRTIISASFNYFCK